MGGRWCYLATRHLLAPGGGLALGRTDAHYTRAPCAATGPEVAPPAPELIVYAKCGNQYICYAYRERSEVAGALPNISWPGNPADNVPA